MASYSSITIDKLHFTYRYSIPTYMTFLFEKNDFYVVYDESEEDSEEDVVPEVGYQTTCAKALDVMNRFGYTLDFFADIYSHFRGDLELFAQEQLAETIHSADELLTADGAQERARKYFVTRGPLHDLQAFINMLQTLQTTDFQKPPFSAPYSYGRIRKQLPPEMQSGEPAKDFLKWIDVDGARLFDFERVESYVTDQYSHFEPGILTILQFLDLADYRDITDLLFARCALEASNPSAVVQLEVTELVDTVEEARALHSQQASLLIDRVNVYNRVFQRLFSTEGALREQHIRSRCKDLLELCASEEKAQWKGRLLEELLELLFTASKCTEVAQKRVSTGDEEIDLVIKNDIDRPFWIAFSSPTFFVECKNWSGIVGAKELRDFETKMRNHARFTKLGFFVSMNGFSREVDSELKRAGREDYHITLIRGSDLWQFAESDIDFFSWLEKRVLEIH